MTAQTSENSSDGNRKTEIEKDAESKREREQMREKKWTKKAKRGRNAYVKIKERQSICLFVFISAYVRACVSLYAHL